MKYLNCPLCHEKVYSGLGEGCKLCGMPLEDDEEFCSEFCKESYNEVHKNEA